MAKRPSSPKQSAPAAAIAAAAPLSLPTAAAAAWGQSSFIGWALGLSLMLHGLLFTVGFRLPEPQTNKARDRGLEVVLVNARHARAPEKAEALAQANLDGGGNSEHDVRAKSPLPPQQTRRDGDALTEARRRQPQEVPRPQQVLAQPEATATVTAAVQQAAPAEQPPRISGIDLLDSAAAIARVEAQIDRKLEEYAKRPRRKFVGARVQEYRFAQYVEDWRQKIERVGTLNYPEAARGKLYGSLLLSVTLRADGTVEKVDIHRSSGHKVLDEAAVRIVGLAGPFAPFPPDIRQDTDMIEIVRTWTFTNNDQVHAN